MYLRDKKRLAKRQMDTLIGISKGIIADGIVSQTEAEFLLNWLETSESGEIDNPIIESLTDRIYDMLEDGLLDNEESQELFEALKIFTGDIPEEGELIKPALPLDDPPPQVLFVGKVFLFTGTFNLGTRTECIEMVQTMGGENSKSLTQKVDYLVIGSYVTPTWKHESHGNKIEKAVNYRIKYGNPAIISEGHFIEAFERIGR